MEENLLSSEAKELLKNIKFIGYCKEGKKISFAQKKYTNAGEISFESFKRNYIYYENNDSCMKTIDEIITNTAKYLKDQENEEILKLFHTSLKDMRVGLNKNLTKTYEDEPSVLSSIAVNIEQLDLLLKRIEAKLEEN